MKKILLTGDSDVGKTTVLKQVLLGVAARKHGFWTERVESGGVRKAFEIVASNGLRLELANRIDVSAIIVGKYFVQTENVQRVCAELVEISSDVSLLYIDEIGQMELAEPSFISLAKAFLDSKKPLIGIISSTFEHPFIAEVKRRDDVEVIEVSLENREVLVAELIRKLTV